MAGTSRRFWLSILLVGVALFALACSGGDDDDSNASSSGGGESEASPANADLRMAGSDPITLDPALAGDAGSATYIVEIFGGLVTLDQNLQIQPDLAESWDVSDDGLTYTFHIRSDAKFHDGKPVTADDFKYSLDRTAKLGQTASATAEAYLGDIVGAKDVTRGRADEISGVVVVDARTLQITIDQPKAYFLAKLTYPTAFVVDKQQVEANPRNWTRKPNGTGPYKMAEWRLNERIILEANDDYHLGAPSVKRILFVLAGGSTLTQYENGELDVAGIGTQDIERVLSDRDPLNAEYKKGNDLSVFYIGFNVEQAPFDDPNVRRAFAMAIDRDTIVRVVLKDLVRPANSFMMPGLPGYNQDAELPPFDPEGAKEALAQSKYEDAAGLGPITLTQIGGGATVGDSTQAIIEMWRENLGVDVSIEQSDQASFYDDLDRGRLQMFQIGWIMDYPDPEDIIDLLFYSTSRQNNTHYASDALDKLVEEARTEADTTKRIQLYQDAEQILIDDLPWIPLYFSSDHFVVKPYVHGFDPVPIVIPRLRYVTIDK